MTAIETNVCVTIDRTVSFDPIVFLGKGGWSIGEEDERSLKLCEVDLTKVVLETMVKENEIFIIGEERLSRLKNAGHIRLDAKVFQTFWENKHLISANWKEFTNGNTIFMFFDGTILQRYGYRYVLFLCCRNGRWEWGYLPLCVGSGALNRSAVLAN